MEEDQDLQGKLPTHGCVDDEIRNRLAQLRGQTSTKEPSRSFLVSGKSKSQAEEVEDLLKQYSAETQLVKQFNETSIDIDSQIEERLRRLKAETAAIIPSSGSVSAKFFSNNYVEQADEDSDDDDDDDSKADAIIRKIIAEEKLARREINEELEVDDRLDELDDPDDFDELEEFS